MTPESIESRFFFLEKRLAEQDRVIQQLRQQLSVTTVNGEVRFPSNRCGLCGLPLESYQAYACENQQCPKPRTIT